MKWRDRTGLMFKVMVVSQIGREAENEIERVSGFSKMTYVDKGLYIKQSCKPFDWVLKASRTFAVSYRGESWKKWGK